MVPQVRDGGGLHRQGKQEHSGQVLRVNPAGVPDGLNM